MRKEENSDWFSLQGCELLKELAQTCDRFLLNGKIEDYDRAEELYAELCQKYKLEIELLELAKIGRLLIGK